MSRGLFDIFAAVAFTLMLVASGPAQDLMPRYEREWTEREQAAGDDDSRARLAADLLAAAEQADDRAYRALLCEHAARWGARQMSSYATAAEALDLLQRTVPERRIWCLSQLRQLYENAYRARPHKLRLGTGLADVLSEIAEQRAETYAAKFDADEVSAAEATRAFATAQRDMSQALIALNRVLKRARTDARRVSRSRPDVARSLVEFVEEFEPRVEQLTQRRGELLAMHADFSRLHRAQVRFERSPDEIGAQHLASVYIVEWDRPELVRPDVRRLLPEDVQQPLQLTLRDPAKLTGEQADRVARWYVSLADSTQTQAQKQNMLIRAKVYRDLADKRGHEAEQHPARRIDRLLIAAGMPETTAAQQVLAMRQRLAYQFGAPPADAVADATPPDHPEPQPRPRDPAPRDRPDATDEPVNSEPAPRDKPTDPEPAPRDVADDQSEPDADTPHAAGGRPMVDCTVCGRRFFPGWDVQTDTCARCKHGHGNIFDFGDD